MNDPVSPSHYKSHPSGVECIELTEHMSFCLGNAIKYLWRAGMKGGVEDLRKARWYLEREIRRCGTSAPSSAAIGHLVAKVCAAANGPLEKVLAHLLRWYDGHHYWVGTLKGMRIEADLAIANASLLGDVMAKGTVSAPEHDLPTQPTSEVPPCDAEEETR